MGSHAVANQTAYINGRTAGCAACSDAPPQPAVYTCAQQVPRRTLRVLSDHCRCIACPVSDYHSCWKGSQGTQPEALPRS